MNLSKRNLVFLAVAAATILVTGMNFRTVAKAKTPVQNSPTDASDTTQAKIAERCRPDQPTSPGQQESLTQTRRAIW